MTEQKSRAQSWFDTLSKVLNPSYLELSDQQKKMVEENKELHQEIERLIFLAEDVRAETSYSIEFPKYEIFYDCEDLKDFKTKSFESIKNANLLLEKISSGLKKSLLKEPLNEEDKKILYGPLSTQSNTKENSDQTGRGKKQTATKGNKAHQVINTTEQVENAGSNKTAKSFENPQKLEPKMNDTAPNEEFEQYRKEIQEKDKIISDLKKEASNLKASLENIKKNFTFDSIENIANNIHFFNEKLMEKKRQQDMESQKDLLNKLSSFNQGGLCDWNSLSRLDSKGPEKGLEQDELLTESEPDLRDALDVIYNRFNNSYDELRSKGLIPY